MAETPKGSIWEAHEALLMSGGGMRHRPAPWPSRQAVYYEGLCLCQNIFAAAVFSQRSINILKGTLRLI